MMLYKPEDRGYPDPSHQTLQEACQMVDNEMGSPLKIGMGPCFDTKNHLPSTERNSPGMTSSRSLKLYQIGMVGMIEKELHIHVLGEAESFLNDIPDSRWIT